jgi:hypothetical protein
MKNICSLPLLFLGLCLSTLAGAQAAGVQAEGTQAEGAQVAGAKVDATLLVKTDDDCNWKLDEQPMDRLKANGSKVVPISPGEHRIRAATTDGVTKIRIDVEIDQGQRFVEILLKDEHDQELKRQRVEAIRRQAETEAALHPTWTDPDTGLMRAKKDNGKDVSWEQASDYCAKSQLGGFNDWRMPTIEELGGIFDPGVSVESVLDDVDWILDTRVKGKIYITGGEWSSSPAHDPGSMRIYNFAQLQENEPLSFPLGGFNYSMRALCVRRPGE